MTETECKMRCEHCLSCIGVANKLECDLTGTDINLVEDCPEGT